MKTFETFNILLSFFKKIDQRRICIKAIQLIFLDSSKAYVRMIEFLKEYDIKIFYYDDNLNLVQSVTINDFID